MLRVFTPMLKRWDLIASSRPDYYFAISNHVKDRIKKYYHRHVDGLMYPPVDTNKFQPEADQHMADKKNTGNYFLLVSRFVPYKRIDLVIDTFNTSGGRSPL